MSTTQKQHVLTESFTFNMEDDDAKKRPHSGQINNAQPVRQDLILARLDFRKTKRLVRV